MFFLKKRQSGRKKFLRVGCFEISYETIKNADKSILKIGSISIPYQRYEKNGSNYFKMFGVSVCIDKLFYNRKQAHYLNREKLTDDYCKKVLQRELADNLGYIPNIDNPRSFNEKILWLKFNDHNPLITKCCDKYAVKEYVKEKIGEEYILPVIGVWNSAKEIDFAKLPNQFAIKVNWSSGYNIIVKDKEDLDIQKVVKKLDSWMLPNKNSYYDTFNWGYKNMEPIIFAEPYIEQIEGQVFDYKFFICNGKFEFLFIATDRADGNVTYTFFDKELNYLPLKYGNKENGNPLPAMPHNVLKMIELSEKLAEPFSFVRVDFYEISKTEFFVGEMTFYSGGGTLPFEPKEWDYKLGELIRIDKELNL